VKLSYRAFKNWVDFAGSPEDLANTLSELGFPNDGITKKGDGLSQVVVGKILTKSAHPQADRLSLLDVSVGLQELKIVCGAQNMKVGDFVALAPVGAKIPGKDGAGMQMKEAKIRGELSQGMCCSLAELQLAEEADGIWILPTDKVNDALLGKKLSEVFDFDDAILEVDVTPNRGDALSLRGLAREVAGKLGLKVKPHASVKWKTPAAQVHPTIENFADSSGFAACLVQGVTFRKSPPEVQKFLEAVGTRSISNLVDVTNVVLFELGHPLHFFDADKVDPKTIGVRRAKAGEKLKLLDGKTIELAVEDLVIADASGPLSLAGIMGAEPSSVTESTKNILIEAASFSPTLIRNSARRHGISSESSYRFERRVTAHKLDEVIERALYWLKEVSGFETAAGSKTLSRDLTIPSVLWDRARVDSKLGKIEVTDDEIFKLLRRLDYEFEAKGSATRVIFPWYRTDANCLEDVMEDIARLWGYEKLPKAPLVIRESIAVSSNARSELSLAQDLLQKFCDRGFSEVLHMSFANPKVEELLSPKLQMPVEVENPIHADKPILRRFLLPQILERAKFNAFHGEDEIRLVEMGSVFSSTGKTIYEESAVVENLNLAVVWLPRAIDKKRLWAGTHDSFFEFKGILESVFSGTKIKPSFLALENLLHPKRRFGIGGSECGELHPLLQKSFDLPGRAFVAEFRIEGGRKAWKYLQPPSVPPIDMDASFVVSREITADKILSIFESGKEKSLEWVRLYDVFESKSLGDDKKSLTFALRYRIADRTLTTDEAKRAHDGLVSLVMKTFPSGMVALR